MKIEEIEIDRMIINLRCQFLKHKVLSVDDYRLYDIISKEIKSALNGQFRTNKKIIRKKLKPQHRPLDKHRGFYARFIEPITKRLRGFYKRN